MNNKIKFLLILLINSYVFADEIQYQDGNSAGTPYGNVMMFNSGGTIKAVTSSVPLPVSASVTPAVDTTASGNITAANSNLNSGTATANSTVATSTLNGVSTADFAVTGTFSATLYAQVSVDGGTTWASLNSSTAITNLNTGAQTSSVTSAGNYQVAIPAAAIFRVTAQSYTSGTAVVAIRASTGVSVSSGGGGGSNGTVAQSSTTSGQNGMLGQGAVTTSAPTYTTAQTNPLSLNTSGGLRVDGSGAIQPVSSATLSTAANQSTEISSLSTIATNSGTQATAANQTTMNGNLSTIVTNTGNSATSSNQTNGNQLTKITNGTQSADTVPGDSGQNGLVQNPAFKSVVFSTTTAQAVATTDVGNMRWVSVHVINAGTNATVNWQSSNDGVNWTGFALLRVDSTANSSGTSIVGNSNIMFQGSLPGRYFRLNITGISSGTCSGVVIFSATAAAYQTMQVAASVTQSGNWLMQGAGASGSAVSGNPLRIGGKALTANSNVTTGQTADAISTLTGAIVQKPFSIPEAQWNYAAAASGISNTTTAVTIASAAGAGLRNYITGCDVTSTALGAGTELAIRDGASGTVIWRIDLTTSGLSGLNKIFSNPIKSTANTLLEVVTLTATITGNVYINCDGYIAP